MPASFIKWFADTGIGDVPLVGGKNASLGEKVRELTAQGMKVPNGFSMTADAYRYFLRATGVDRQIGEILTGLDTRDIENLRSRALQVRQAILGARLPEDLETAIIAAYEQLRGSDAHPPDVAVRSSAGWWGWSGSALSEAHGSPSSSSSWPTAPAMKSWKPQPMPSVSCSIFARRSRN